MSLCLYSVLTLLGMSYGTPAQLTPAQLISENNHYLRSAVEFLPNGEAFRWVSTTYELSIPRRTAQDIVIVRALLSPVVTTATLRISTHDYPINPLPPPTQVRTYAILADYQFTATHAVRFEVAPRRTADEDIAWAYFTSHAQPASMWPSTGHVLVALASFVLAVFLLAHLSEHGHITVLLMHGIMMLLISIGTFYTLAPIFLWGGWTGVQLLLYWWYHPVRTYWRLGAYLSAIVGLLYWTFGGMISPLMIITGLGISLGVGWLTRTYQPSERMSMLVNALIISLAFGVTVLRTYHGVNGYAFSQWLLSYDLGFVKRGLVGSIIPEAWQTPIAVSSISTIVWLIWCIGILWYIWRTVVRFRNHDIIIIATIILVSSPFIMVMTHVQGQFDHLIIPMSWWMVWAWYRTHRWRYIALVLAGLSVLIHEMSIVFISSALIIVMGHAWAIRTPQQPIIQWWRSLRGVIIASIFPAALTGLLILYNQRFVDGATVYDHLLARYQAFPFITTPARYAEWVVMPFSTHMARYGQSWARLQQSYALWMTIPLLVFLLGALSMLRPQHHRAWVFFGATVISILGTQLLHSIAYDTGRIVAYAIGVLWFALFVRQHDTIETTTTHPLFTLIGLGVVIGIQSLDSIRYWDSMYENILTPTQRAWMMLIVIYAIIWRLVRTFFETITHRTTSPDNTPPDLPQIVTHTPAIG